MAGWFGAGLRTSMAVEVEEIVNVTGLRGYGKCHHNEAGRDGRPSAPGVCWVSLRQRRYDVLDSLRENCQEAFDKVYEQIMQGRRTSMSQHLLPTMKTPAVLKKTKSRTLTKSSPSLSPPHSTTVTSPPPHSFLSTPPLTSVFTPHSTARMNTEVTQSNTAVVTDKNDVNESDKENAPIAILLDSVETAPVKGKLKNDVKTEIVKEQKREERTTRRETRASVRRGEPKSSLANQPPASSTRSTRSRTTRAAAARVGSDIKAMIVDENTSSEPTTTSITTTAEKEETKTVVDAALGSAEIECVSTEEEEEKMEVDEQERRPEVMIVDASPPDAAVRRLTRSRVKQTAPLAPAPSSPLLRSHRKRFPNISPAASSNTRRTLRSASTASARHTTSSPQTKAAGAVVEAVTSPSRCNKGTLANTKTSPAITLHKNRSPLTDITTPFSLQQLDSNSLPLGWYTAQGVTPQNGKPVHTAKGSRHTAFEVVESDSEDFHTPECRFISPQDDAKTAIPQTATKLAQLATGNSGGSDSGVGSECKEDRDRERRSGSSRGVKRLRSVSLEKLSISDIDAKRISMIIEANREVSPAAGGGVKGGEEGMFLFVNSPDSGSSEEEATDVLTSEENNVIVSESSQDDLQISPTSTQSLDSELSPTGSSDNMTDSSSPGGEEEAAPSHSASEQQREMLQGVGVAGGSGTPQRLQTAGNLSSALDFGFKRSPVVNLKKTKASPWSFLSKKGDGVPLKLVLPTDGRPTTFLSCPSPKRPEGEGKLALANGTTLPLSFLPRSSPQQIQKAESKEARQRKLVERMRRKKEDEEQRKRELEEKRLLEVEERKRRNAERAKRAAEKRRQEEEKKLLQRKKDFGCEELSKKQQQMILMKENERKEKTKKHNEHVAAVLGRKKQEEEQKTKKLQQIEEDRKMAEELHKQRLEREEEERQVKRSERQKQERERQLQREAEERERQLQREAEERERLANRETDDTPETDVLVEAKAKRQRALPGEKKDVFQQLLASTCTVNMPTAASRFIQEWKNKVPAQATANTTTVTKSKPTLPASHDTLTTANLEKCPPPLPYPRLDTSNDNSAPQTQQSSANLNATFTKDTSPASVVESSGGNSYETPCKNSASATSLNVDSYNITPAGPLLTNYDINDLSSGDSTDEEDRPKKPIPTWALPSQLNTIMLRQEEKIYDCSVDPCRIFPSAELLKDVDLARIFKQKRKRFYHRSSSARWDSPILSKKGKIDGISAGLF